MWLHRRHIVNHNRQMTSEADKAGWRRILDRRYSKEQQLAVLEVAEEIDAEQRRTGRIVPPRETSLRLLIDGLGIAADEAARQVDAAFAADELPPSELRAALG